MSEFYQDDDKKLWHKEVDLAKLFPEAFKGCEEVIHLGGRKYGYDSYLDPATESHQHKANHASCFRHLSESSCNPGGYIDSESGVDTRLHIIIRLLQAYTRDVRGISNHE